jgi:hypothetical protein
MRRGHYGAKDFDRCSFCDILFADCLVCSANHCPDGNYTKVQETYIARPQLIIIPRRVRIQCTPSKLRDTVMSSPAHLTRPA